MASLKRYRDMTPAEVARIHAGLALVERENRTPEQIVADLVCYCGGSWPNVGWRTRRDVGSPREVRHFPVIACRPICPK